MSTPDQTAPRSTPRRRALVVFVPSNERYLLELWTLVRCVDRVAGDMTDIVCFGPEHLRKKAGPHVRFIAHPDRSEELYDGYRFAPRHDFFLSDQIHVLREYGHLVRTDTDVFLTPAFASHRPTRFTVGQGSYVHDEETRTTILESAKHLGLRHQGIHNVGSTWHGPSEQVIEVGRLTAEILPELLDRLRGRTDTSPMWLRGVAGMYAAEIAVNHVVDEPVVDGQRFDAESSRTSPTAESVHLHSHRTDRFFSKGMFHRGEYDGIDSANLDPTRVDEFCLGMAFEGRAAWQSHLAQIDARSADRATAPNTAAPPVPLDDILSAIAAHGLRDDVDLPADGAFAAQWSDVLDGCRQHRLVGLLHQAWTDGALTLGERQDEELRALHRSQRLACRRIEHHLLAIVDRLDTEGIESRVLKGIAAARTLYPEPALRPFHDADLLIRADDLARVQELLELDGARRPHPEPRPGFDREFGKGLEMVMPDGYEIDVHRTLVQGWYGLRVDVDELFDGGKPFDLHGNPLTALSADRALAHACYHATLSGRRPTLITQRDIVLHLLADDGAIERARDLARAWEGEAILAIAVREAWDTLRPIATPAAVEWARSYEPGPRDRRRLAAYQGGFQDAARLRLDAIPAIQGMNAKVRYVTAMALPRLSGRSHTDRWKQAYRSLRPW